MTGAGTKNFDPAVRAAAVETYVKGESAERVAALFGCSKPAVLKWVRAAGVPVRNRRGPRRPSVAVPRRAEVAPPPAPPPPPPPPVTPRLHRYSEETVTRALERYADGESAEVIARGLGCSPTIVRDWGRARGVTVRDVREAAFVRVRRAAAERDRALAAGEEPRRPGPRPGLPARRGTAIDEDEVGRVLARVPLAPPTASDAQVVITIVASGDGDLRLIARTTVPNHQPALAPTVQQHSWDPMDTDRWARGVLALLARAASPKALVKQEERDGR